MYLHRYTQHNNRLPKLPERHQMFVTHCSKLGWEGRKRRSTKNGQRLKIDQEVLRISHFGCSSAFTFGTTTVAVTPITHSVGQHGRLVKIIPSKSKHSNNLWSRALHRNHFRGEFRRQWALDFLMTLIKVLACELMGLRGSPISHLMSTFHDNTDANAGYCSLNLHDDT